MTAEEKRLTALATKLANMLNDKIDECEKLKEDLKLLSAEYHPYHDIETNEEA
jgi:hypothetical protein